VRVNRLVVAAFAMVCVLGAHQSAIPYFDDPILPPGWVQDGFCSKLTGQTYTCSLLPQNNSPCVKSCVLPYGSTQWNCTCSYAYRYFGPFTVTEMTTITVSETGRMPIAFASNAICCEVEICDYYVPWGNDPTWGSCVPTGMGWRYGSNMWTGILGSTNCVAN
jgi:hypothetical protein